MRAVIAVLWAFFGVRRQAEYDQDAARITPKQAILTGIALAALFVLGLIVLVRVIVAR
jgi:preprotein translocase subunit Sec61beta